MVAAAVCGGRCRHRCDGFNAGARAAFMTGNDLYQKCASSGFVENGQCAGYLEAIADALETSPLHGGLTACVPTGVQLGQVRDVVMKLLTNAAEIRQWPAETLVAMALAPAFPCSK
jgi:hypothetical protein